MMLSKEEVSAVSVAHKALVDLKMKLCDHRCEICPFVSHTQGPASAPSTNQKRDCRHSSTHTRQSRRRRGGYE